MRRIRLFLRQNYAYAPLIGLLLTIGGIFAGYRGHPYWLTLLVGVGTSLIAAGLVTFLSPSTDDMYQQFLGLGIRQLWPSRRDVPPDNWCTWLRTARKHCILLGVAHGEWRRDDKFLPALNTCLAQGVKVKMLFLDPTSELAGIRAREEQRDTPRIIGESIRIIWEMRTEIDERFRDNLILYVYNATPSSGTTWVDSRMVITHYLAGYPNRTSPAFLVEDVGGDSLFAIYQRNLDRLVQAETTVRITEENVAAYSR